jgi:membrane-associated phospholipid phosphatase
LNAPFTGEFDVAVTNELQHALSGAPHPVLEFGSLAGGTIGWLLVAALAFWWSGSHLGLRVALVSSASALSNVLLKWIFVQPRPYFVSDGINALEAADGFGMPSGHTQGTATTWGALARWGGQRWLWVVGALWTILVALSRVYYGVHSVLQVLCGGLFGLLAVAVASALEKPFVRWWARASPAMRWTAAIIPAAALFALGLILRELVFAVWEAPEAWVARHIATSLRLDPAAATEDLRLIDSTLLTRGTGGVLGSSLVAAWYGSPGRPAFVVTSARQGAIGTAIGLLAMAAILAAGEPVVRWLGEFAEVPRFALLLWATGVVVPRLSERLEAAVERRAFRGG